MSCPEEFKEQGYLEKLKKENRIGEVNISFQMLRAMSKQAINIFFTNFIISRAEYFYHTNCMKYIGFNGFFRKVESGENIPLYQMKCITNQDGDIVSLEWIELKE